jgi:hypothetical protein
MVYAKIKDNVIIKYPLTIMDIRKEFPSVSFPAFPSNDELLPYNYVQVIEVYKPDDTDTYTSVEVFPKNINGKWTQSFELVELTDSELTEKASELMQNIRDTRNRLLWESDWTQLADSPVDKQKWAMYRQQLRDITKQHEFPNLVTWPQKPD